MKQCQQCGASFTDTVWKCPFCHWKPALSEGFPSFVLNPIGANDDFPPYAHEKLAHLEDSCFWFRGRNKLLQNVLASYFQSAERLLEVGCGTGFVLAGFAKTKPRMSLAGGEIFPAGLREAKRRVPHAELLHMDARYIPYVNEFDVVGAFDVLEHIEDDRGVLREMCKAVKPGGGVIVTVPQHQGLWSAFDDIACHKRRYSRKELKEKMEDAGFQVHRLTSFVSLLLPLMILSRWTSGAKEKPAKRERVLRGFSLPGKLDFLLERICYLERVLFQWGLNFPAGGSLLCVGVKA